MFLRPILKAAILAATITTLPPLAHSQNAEKPSRDPVDSLPERELLPKMPGKRQAWRPIYSIDDVPEVAFEEMQHPCEDKTTHVELTLNKIRRLDRERPDGFLRAIEKYRPDLKDLPFLFTEQSAMTPARRAIQSDFSGVFFGFVASEFHPADPFFLPQALVVRRFMPANRERASLRSEEQFEAIASFAMQKLFPIDTDNRLKLVQILQSLPYRQVTRYLADVAAFAPEAEVREAAIASLQVRAGGDHEIQLLQRMTYPLPSVVHNAATALIKLNNEDDGFLERVAGLLEYKDVGGAWYNDELPPPSVGEVVKINHLRNCMLCHPPSPLPFPGVGNALHATLPNPREQLPATFQKFAGYGGIDLVRSIRFDITYLRPDFSLTLPVDEKAHGGVWPEQQRFDFLVRNRKLTPREYARYQKSLPYLPPSATHVAALRVLWEITGRNAEPNFGAWTRAIREFTTERMRDKSF